MSKRNNFGRFTALSLAGISALSSMAIVSVAEAYPTNVYEFTYGGIAKTQTYKTTVVSAAINNDYVDDENAQAVFESGFVVEGMGDFCDIINEADATLYTSVNFDGNSGWIYYDVNALTGNKAPALPAEYIEDRETANGYRFFFKTKAERDNAVNQIVAANKAEYAKKLSAATSALNTNLSGTISAYNKDVQAKITKMTNDLNKYFKDNPDMTAATVTYSDYPGLDTTLPTVVYKSAKDKADKTDLTVSELASKQKASLAANVKELNTMATQIKNEFAEMYKSANYAFADYQYKTDATVFKIDDSNTSVTFSEHVGQYIKPSEATYGPLDLNTCWYRTVGDYINSESYAFTGEIITGDDRKNTSIISAALLDSNRWSDFSAVIEGKPSDNENTTESSKETEKEDDWHPDAGYRVPNSSYSYKGENGYWYTSEAAAIKFGNGYSGTLKSSNYTNVMKSEYIYFNAADGNYYSSAVSKYCYLVATNPKKEEEKNTNTNTNYTDPYYYYLLANQNNKNNTTVTDPDAPTIYGSSKRAGWSKILAAVKTAGNGATVTIDMNGDSVIPADVVKAAAAGNVTLKAVNSNGSIFTVKGSDINYATSIDTTVQYNVKVVSDSLKNKAIRVNKGAVSTTQVVISETGDLGCDATVTVKLSSKRAGYTVKAYRVSADAKKLTCEAKGVVKSNGSVNLGLDNGGKYVLVIIK